MHFTRIDDQDFTGANHIAAILIQHFNAPGKAHDNPVFGVSMRQAVVFALFVVKGVKA